MVEKERKGPETKPRKSGPEVGPGKAAQARRGGLGRPAVLGAVGLVLACVAVVGGAALFSKTPAANPTSIGGLGGPFHLVDQDGKPVDQSILKGKWSAVFFGYTYCPDVCPATLQALGAASRALGPAGANFQVVFVSVDPERDTPAQMKTYIASQGFPAHIFGLTGTPQAVAQIAKSYGVYYAKAGTGADYTVDHSAAVYLMDPQGRFNRPFSHDMSPTLIADQIKAAQGD